jgi:2-keto-3-deoxy-galactonokinase
LAGLFSVRARDLLESPAAGDARACLSATLIATELKGVLKTMGASPVVLLGAGEICNLYRVALHAAGISARMVDADGMTLRGLTYLREQSSIT